MEYIYYNLVRDKWVSGFRELKVAATTEVATSTVKSTSTVVTTTVITMIVVEQLA